MRVSSLVLALVVSGVWVGSSQATVYLSEIAFNAALGTRVPDWSEDFQGFALGPVPDPLGIAGGNAEVLDGGNAFIVEFPGPGERAWLQGGGTPTNATIRGLGGTSLGVPALSFTAFSQAGGSWTFNHSQGSEASLAISPDTFQFVGWIADGNETLDNAVFSSTQGMILDDIVGYIESVVATAASTWGEIKTLYK